MAAIPVNWWMTYPPSLSLETGEAQIGGFFILHEIYQASSSLRRSSRFVDPARPRLPRQRLCAAVAKANRILPIERVFHPVQRCGYGQLSSWNDIQSNR